MQKEQSLKKESSDESKAENSSSKEQRDKEENNNQVSVWEWLIAFVGFVLVVGVIVFLLYKAFLGSELPPDVKLQLESVEQVSNGYLVKFSALNRGSETLAGVLIEAELKRGEEKTETSQTTINFLPAHSIRRGGFFFRSDPRQSNLQMHTLGYEEP